MNLSQEKAPGSRLPSMSEWLDIMLGEVARKKEEEKSALEEAAQRDGRDAKENRLAADDHRVGGDNS